MTEMIEYQTSGGRIYIDAPGRIDKIPKHACKFQPYTGADYKGERCKECGRFRVSLLRDLQDERSRFEFIRTHERSLTHAEIIRYAKVLGQIAKILEL